MWRLRIPAIALIILLRVIVFVTTYNTFWRHVDWPVRLSWGADMIGFLVLCFIVLYDDIYFVRRVPLSRHDPPSGLP